MGRQRKRERKDGGPIEARSPYYDDKLHELRIGDVVVKRLTQKSDAQETILKAFQEESWSQSIDDPLPGKEGHDAKQRLRMTVANLNRRQRVRLLHFRVIEQGTAVAWEFASASDSRATQQRH